MLVYHVFIMYIYLHVSQLEMKARLRAGLSNLPAPRNDFEIVVPENVSLFLHNVCVKITDLIFLIINPDSQYDAGAMSVKSIISVAEKNLCSWSKCYS